MNADALAAAVTLQLRGRASEYGLDAGGLRVTRVLNWGGFGNPHFSVGDGARTLHLKLADDDDAAEELRRWRVLGPELEVRYRAPRIVDWFALEGGGPAGLLFERIEGASPALTRPDPLLSEILQLLQALHGDGGLHRELGALGLTGGARDSVLDHHVATMESDLREFGARYPVAPALVAWMADEVAALRACLERSPALDRVDAVPIHGDLWADNVIVRPDGRWFVLDWDGLGPGDPALDLAVLLSPLHRAGGDHRRLIGPWGPETEGRVQLYLRAGLLDEVVDSLADWVEAEALPEHTALVREKKMQVHQQALVLYRSMYAGPFEALR